MTHSAASQILGPPAEWVIQNSLESSVLLLLVALVQISLRSWLTPTWRYALWLLVAFRLVLPGAPSTGFSLFNLRPHTNAMPSPLASRQPNSSPAPFSDKTPAALSPVPTPASPTPDPTRAPQRQDLIGIVWAVGVVMRLLVIAWRFERFRRRATQSPTLTDPSLLQLWQSCCTHVGVTTRAPLIHQLDDLPTPVVFGLWRPRLLVPKRLLNSLSTDDWRMVFCHELLHVKRRDLWWNWLFILIQALHWFNPLVHIAFRQLRAARELARDAQLLGHLGNGERSRYAATLLKLAEQMSLSRMVSTVVPVLNRKSELRRRLLMITQPQTKSRSLPLIGILTVLVLGSLTFTGAENKSPTSTPPPPKGPPADPIPEPPAAQQRGIRVLEQEVSRVEDLIHTKQDELSMLKEKLHISAQEEFPSVPATGPEHERLLALQRQLIETQATAQQLVTLLEKLASMKQTELRKALPTISPDAFLSSLLENLAQAEQRLVVLQENHAKDHPDVRAARILMERINRQVDERIEGILLGLKTRFEISSTQQVNLQKQLESAQAQNIEAAIRSRPYFQAKRDLETLALVRERLQMRIAQERIDAAVQAPPPPPR